MTLWTVAHQAPPSTGFFQARILEWVPFPSPGDLPDTETELASCALPGGSLPLSHYKNLGVKLGVGKTTQL